jgi:aminoglycoside/choline kinase family phosphotransferase
MLEFLKNKLIGEYKGDIKNFENSLVNTEFALIQLKKDASLRNYYRFKNEKTSESYVLMEMAPSQIVSEEGGNDKKKLYKLNGSLFVDVYNYLCALNIDIPKIFSIHEDVRILIMEDVGDTTLHAHIDEKNPSSFVHLYKKAIDQLLIFQIEGTNLYKSGKSTCAAFYKEFDYNLFNWEFNHFIEYGLDKTRDKLNKLTLSFQTISKILSSEEKCLTHRDYHSKNLMVFGDRLVILDFQDALLGPYQYDLASLLRDAYVALDDNFASELLDYYIENLEKKLGKKIDRKNFIRIFDLTAIQRDLKAFGRFEYIAKVKGNPSYLQYIPNLKNYIKKTLEKYPEFEIILEIL